MDRLGGLEVLVAVADTGGLSRAAARLRMSAPAVTRALAALEARLGVALFVRTTRSVRPTEAGLRLAAQARRLLAELEEAEKEAGGAAAVPSGHLSVTAPVTFGRLHVAPVLADVLRAYPALSASLVGVDRRVNLVEEGHDVAVRIGELGEANLIARRLGSVRRIVVASLGYLARAGVPGSPEAVRGHALVAFAGTAGRQWRFERAGRAEVVEVAPRLEVNDAQAAIALAEAGEGLSMVLSYQAAESLRAGRLVRVLEDFAPAPVPVHIVYPPARLVAPKLRAFIDMAAPALARRLVGLGVG